MILSLVLITKEGGKFITIMSKLHTSSTDVSSVYGPLLLRYLHGQTTAAEVAGGSCPTVHLIWTPIPSTLTLLPEQSKARWGFVLSVADSLESARATFDEALNLMATGNLRLSHENAWKELWLQSTLEVTGSERLSKALIGCMFYLLSAFPSIHDSSGSFGGVSPGGLSNGGDGQDYWGHVFWDQVRLVLSGWLPVLYVTDCMM